MKRLFRKDNRIARFIALALVLIMALTPLYQHSGLKKPTKAANLLLVQTGITNATYNDTVSIPGSVEVNEETGAFTVGATESTPAEINVSSFASFITFNIKVNESVCSNSDSYIIKDAEVCFVASTQDPGESILAEDSSISDSNTIDVSTNKNVYVYLKAVKVTDTYGTFEETYTATEYTKIATIKVTTLGNTTFGGASWVSGDAAVSTYASSATITPGFECIDTVKYLATNDDKLPSDDQWASASTTPVTVGGDGKTYYGYVGVFDGDTSVTSPGYVYRLDAIKIDSVFPARNDNQGAKILSVDGKTQYANIGLNVVGAFTATYSDVVYLDSNVGSVEFRTYVVEKNLADGAIELGFYPNGSENPAITYNSRQFDSMGTNGGFYTTTVTTGDLSENTVYQVKAKIKDKAGNESNLLYATICLIDKTLKVGTDIQIQDGGNVSSIGPTFGTETLISNKPHVLNLSITSGNVLEQFHLTVNDGSYLIYDDDFENTKVNNLYTDNTKSYVFNEQREYKNIQVKIVDGEWGEGKTVDLGSFIYDATAPDFGYVGLFKYDADEDKWNDISADVDSVGNHWLDTTSITTTNLEGDTYRLVFKAKDELSGLNGGSYYITSDTTKATTALSSTTTTNVGDGYTEYSIELTTDAIMKKMVNGNLSFTAYAMDKADNSSAESTSVNIKATDTTLYVDALLMDGEDAEKSNEVVLSLNNNTNKAYYLHVTMQSGYPLDMLTLDYEDEDETGAIISKQLDSSTITDDDNNKGYNAETKVYTITKVIPIPKDITKNQLLTAVTLTVSDKCSIVAQSKTESVGTLLFDQTKPVVSLTTPETKWYQEYQMHATITPGPQDANDPEANITQVTYNISNAGDNNLNGNDLNAGVMYVDDNKYATIDFYVPESANPAGTMITFNASDEAGNPLADENKEVSVKVDATAPTVDYIKINDADVKTTNYGPSIKITTAAKDNLSLDTVTITVQKKQEDGTYADIEAGQTYNISNEGITSQFFEYPKSLSLADGDYKVTVVARDKSGRTSADDTDVTNEEVFFTVNGALTATGTIYTLADFEAGNTTDGKTSFDTKDVDDTVTHTVSNQKHKLVVEVRSGYDFETCLLKSGSEVKTTLDFTDKKYENGFYTAKVEYTFGEHGSVKYEDLYIDVKDKNPDTTKSTVSQSLGTFIYDEDAPKVEFEGLYISTDKGATWRKINDDPWAGDTDIAQWVYVINVTRPTDLYRFVYDVEESTSGIKDDLALHGKTIEKNTEATKMSAGSTNEEYIAEFTAAELAADIEANGNDNRLSYKVKFVDNALNESNEVGPWYDIEKPDGAFGIDAVLYRVDGESRVAVDLNGDDYYANTPYILEVTTTTLLGVDTITLYDGTDSESPEILATRKVTEEENEAGWNELHKEFIVKVDILVPYFEDEADIKNLILNNMYVKAIDRGGVETEPQLLGSMLYDQTLPVLVNNKSDDGTLADDPKWYTEYAFDALITAGPQGENAVESQIGSASYTMTGSADDKEDQNLDIEDGKVKVTFDVPESTTLAGTTVVFSASDMAGNQLESNNVAVIRVDATKPSVDTVRVYDENGYEDLVGENVTIDMTATDNLGFEKISVKVEQIAGGTATFSRDFGPAEGTLTETDAGAVQVDCSYALSGLDDGTYKVTVTAYDKANTASEVTEISSKTFEVDGSAPTKTNVKISSGTMGGKKPMKNYDDTDRDYYYKSDVVVEFTYTEKNAGAIEVKDGNTTVTGLKWERVGDSDTYVAKYTVKEEGLHNISVSVSDMTGHSSKSETISFVKDTNVPTISVLMNGAINYNESMGQRLSTTDTTLAFTESEDNKDEKGFYYKVKKTVPDETPVVGKYGVTPYRSFTYSEEAEYEVQVYSVDMANNTSLTRTVQFRIDKTAPNISIGGITSGGTSSTAVTLSFNMQELYWRDAEGTVQIYVKSGEGFGEELVEEFAYSPNGRNSVMTRTLSESGIYRVEFTANDSAQHTAEASSTFTIDTEVPVVTLEGVSNYDVTDQDVTITSTITDKFYASKKVTISGTMTDETGKVTPITIDDYSPTANPTIINKTFSADGIYDLTITCVDVAGNSDSKSVHFTIDKSEPIIGDLSHIDGKILTSFTWEEDLDELVSDLTVCDVHMYLNGQEYNGEDAVEDGSYILLITAEDELGHKVEKSVEFVLDTKAPVFIVTGVEDKEKKIEPYSISVSLQLDEDSLTKVTLNGEVITITNNMATFDVTEVGEYKLYMEATDEAGNVSSAEYEFELESEKEFNFWIILAILALLMIIIIIIIILKRKKDKE